MNIRVSAFGFFFAWEIFERDFAVYCYTIFHLRIHWPTKFPHIWSEGKTRGWRLVIDDQKSGDVTLLYSVTLDDKIRMWSFRSPVKYRDYRGSTL